MKFFEYKKKNKGIEKNASFLLILLIIKNAIREARIEKNNGKKGAIAYASIPDIIENLDAI